MLVSTGEISDILTNSAIVTGEILNPGDGATQHGHCYAKTTDPTVAASKTALGIPPGTKGFTSHLTNLEAGTIYYVKAYMSNGTETVYGNEISFTTTAPSVPAISTTSITSITSTTAFSGGNITDNGGAPVTSRGVCWDSSSGPTISNEKTLDGTGAGSFISSLTGLSPNTEYYIRAYATNSAGTAYGNEISFMSTNTTLRAATEAPSAIATTSVILHGVVNAYNTNTSVTFEYGLTTDYGNAITAVENPVTGITDNAVSASTTGLTANTTYHFRVKAESISGTVFGDDLTFTTTGAVTDIDGNVYNTVKIGSQLWMIENLKVTMYNDNSPIPYVTDDAAWSTIVGPAYCWYNNSEATFGQIYGALYNWYSIVSGKLCPTGWHVPTDAEWTTLITYLGGEAVAGGKLKETGTTHWWVPNDGATNESGFTALPGGSRAKFGAFRGNGEYGSWLSASEFDSELAWERTRRYDNGDDKKDVSKKLYGGSVRCLEGKASILIYLAPIITNPVSNITDISATIGGTVFTEGNASVLERGVCWSVSPGPTTSNSRTTDGSGSGSYVSRLYDLLPGTYYYVRAYARNSAGTAYGNEISFITLPCPGCFY